MGKTDEEKAAEAAAKAEAEAAAAKAAAAEAARVQGIRNQINDLNKKVTAYKGTIEKLQNSKRNLKTALSDWSRVSNSCKSSNITNNVVVKNKFEGECAKAIARNLEKAKKRMAANNGGIKDVIEKLTTQISKLQSHVGDLETKISSLNDSI